MAANQTVTQYGSNPPDYMLKPARSENLEVYGLAYPLGSNSKGYFTKSSGQDMIKNSIRQLITTERGERLMLPGYGCNLKKFLFQPLSEDVFEDIKREILLSFDRYIVGATVVKIIVLPYGETGPAGGNSLLVNLTISLNSEKLEVFDVEVNIS